MFLVLLLPFSIFAEEGALLSPAFPEVEAEVELEGLSFDEAALSLPLSSTEEIAALGDAVQVAPITSPLDVPDNNSGFIKPTKRPGVAAFLSALVPGLGHYYLGEFERGSQLLGSSLAGGGAAYASRKDPSLFATSLYTVQAVSSYGIYAAYRDAHLYNGDSPPNMPRDDMKGLTTAPFQWSVMKKPEVWGGCLGALALGITVAYFAFPKDGYARVKTAYVEPLSALPIAIGEESLFRGFLQTSLTEVLPPWGAITLSSLAFAAAHIPNAQALEPHLKKRYYAFSLPFIGSLGAYMGWLTYKNRSLKESVALHAWYDFTLLCGSVLATTASIGERRYISHSWEF